MTYSLQTDGRASQGGSWLASSKGGGAAASGSVATQLTFGMLCGLVAVLAWHVVGRLSTRLEEYCCGVQAAVARALKPDAPFEIEQADEQEEDL